ncbi:hypothetical protein HGA88_04220 [Candidatus Roizmanbacteria bacterium]|nr:hypothetical protein [Candidatus Roizmanbacteria bacterium]
MTHEIKNPFCDRESMGEFHPSLTASTVLKITTQAKELFEQAKQRNESTSHASFYFNPQTQLLLSNREAATDFSQLRDNSPMMQIDAFTVGRSEGVGSHTMLTAMSPTSTGFVGGYFVPSYDEPNNQIRGIFKPIFIEQSFAAAQAHYQIIRTKLNETQIRLLAADAQFAPLITPLISEAPFNTLSPWIATHNTPEDLQQFLKNITSPEMLEDYYKKYGGMCTVLTWLLGDRIQNAFSHMTVNVVRFPSFDPPHPDAHSGLLIKDHNYLYFADPGMTLPSVLPVPNASDIPMFQTNYPQKNIYLIPNTTSSEMPCDIVIAQNKNFMYMNTQSTINFDRFKEETPAQLPFVCSEVSRPRIVYFDSSGRSTLVVGFDPESTSLIFKLGTSVVAFIKSLASTEDTIIQTALESLPPEYRPLVTEETYKLVDMLRHKINLGG